MEVRTKTNIVDERGTPFMGPGLLRLLNCIRELRSINKAAKEMRLSYVKALHLLNTLESNLGQRVLIRKRGGNERGGAELTALGEVYVQEYSLLEEGIRESADREFALFLERLEKRRGELRRE